jgi:hypothetical protein
LKKKILIGIAIFLIFGSLLLYFDRGAVDEDTVSEENISENQSGDNTLTESPDIDKENETSKDEGSGFINNIYETKISENQSQTVYFGLDNEFTVYFFSNDLITSEMHCTYELSQDAKTITVYYPDGEETDFEFKFDSANNKIYMNDQEYIKSSKTKETIFDG